jgi:hypothetical protein
MLFELPVVISSAYIDRTHRHDLSYRIICLKHMLEAKSKRLLNPISITSPGRPLAQYFLYS